MNSVNRTFVLAFVAALAAAPLAGCPSSDPPPAEPLDVAGTYAVVATQLDSECVGAEWDFWEVYDFMERTPQDIPSMTMEVTQDGGAIAAALSPGGCSLDGTVGPTGTFSLRGPCDTATMDRDLEISGTIAEFGAGFDIEASMRIDVDRDDGAGGAPDGVIDCSVPTVDLDGSGSRP